jgi:hypothetical protein
MAPIAERRHADIQPDTQPPPMTATPPHAHSHRRPNTSHRGRAWPYARRADWLGKSPICFPGVRLPTPARPRRRGTASTTPLWPTKTDGSTAGTFWNASVSRLSPRGTFGMFRNTGPRNAHQLGDGEGGRGRPAFPAVSHSPPVGQGPHADTHVPGGSNRGSCGRISLQRAPMRRKITPNNLGSGECRLKSQR